MSAVVSPGSYRPIAAANLTTLTSADVNSGCILYLPLKDEVMQSLAKHGSQTDESVSNLTFPSNKVNDKFYKHFILVISRPSDAPNKIHFLFLTTFKGKTIDQKFKYAGTRHRLKNYLAIEPSPDHPLLATRNLMYHTLKLREGATMPKCGYAKISEVYAMEWRLAQPCWRDSEPPVVQRWRLDDESLTAAVLLVKKVCGYDPGEQYDASGPMSRQILDPLQGSARTPTTVAGPSTAIAERTKLAIPPNRTAMTPSHTALAMGSGRSLHMQQSDETISQMIDEAEPLLGCNQRGAPKGKKEPSRGFMCKIYMTVIRFICFLVVRVKQTGVVLMKSVGELTVSCFGGN